MSLGNHLNHWMDNTLEGLSNKVVFQKVHPHIPDNRNFGKIKEFMSFISVSSVLYD
jgi:hypothetical protein